MNLRRSFCLLIIPLSFHSVVAKKTESLVEQLIAAAAAENVKKVRALIAAKADVNGKDKLQETTPLFAGARNPEIVRMLLKAGAEVDTRALEGRTALMSASFADDPECVRLLLAAGAQVNLQDDTGRTALIMAALAGKVANVRLLLKAGATVNIQDKSGVTALRDTCCGTAAIELVRLLVDAGGDPNIADHRGGTPLMSVVVFHNLEAMEILLRAGAKANAQNIEGDTALIYAAHQSGQKETAFKVADLLVRHGADVNLANLNGETAIMEASQECYPEMVRALIQLKADVNVKDKNGSTVLDSTCSKRFGPGGGANEIRKALQAAGAKKGKI